MIDFISSGLNEGPVTNNEVVLAVSSSLFLSFLLAFHFFIFGQTYSTKRQYFRVIPVIAVATCAIILVVKSSLSLSLGLIGALSIVRFRTPVKEPEELAYLFLAILIGISQGANLFFVGYFSLLAILIIMAVIKFPKFNRGLKEVDYIISVVLSDVHGDTEKVNLEAKLSQYFREYKIIRFVWADEGLELVFSCAPIEFQMLEKFKQDISDAFEAKVELTSTVATDPLM